MKTLAQQVLMTLFVGLLVPVANAQALSPGDLTTGKNAFEVSMFLGNREKVNLMLEVRQPKRVTIRLKNASNRVLYKEALGKKPSSYWRKFDFEGAKTGTYYFEISDGQNRIVRQLEVGILPEVPSQRFISYVQ